VDNYHVRARKYRFIFITSVCPVYRLRDSFAIPCGSPSVSLNNKKRKKKSTERILVNDLTLAVIRIDLLFVNRSINRHSLSLVCRTILSLISYALMRDFSKLSSVPLARACFPNWSRYPPITFNSETGA